MLPKQKRLKLHCAKRQKAFVLHISQCKYIGRLLTLLFRLHRGVIRVFITSGKSYSLYTLIVHVPIERCIHYSRRIFKFELEDNLVLIVTD